MNPAYRSEWRTQKDGGGGNGGGWVASCKTAITEVICTPGSKRETFEWVVKIVDVWSLPPLATEKCARCTRAPSREKEGKGNIIFQQW